MAIEITLLHNFVWHVRYTWRDRQSGISRTMQLVRFHLSNGLVSMFGNALLMWLLVREAHLKVMVSNAIAILCCSVINFSLGNSWAFPEDSRSERCVDSEANSRLPIASLTVGILLLLAAPGMAAAQGSKEPEDSVPDAPNLGADAAYLNVFVGPAASVKSGVGQGSFTSGVTFGEYYARKFGRGIAASPQFELGLVGGLPHSPYVDGLFSIDEMISSKIPHHALYPSITVGYSRLFVTGNAINAGIGIDFGKREYKRLMRIEVRDYYVLTSPQQHIVGLRIGFGKLVPD